MDVIGCIQNNCGDPVFNISSIGNRQQRLYVPARVLTLSKRVLAGLVDRLLVLVMALTPVVSFALIIMAFPEAMAPIDETASYGNVALSWTMILAVSWLALSPLAFWVGFEHSRMGATPGKLLVGLQVEHEDGTRLTLGEAASKYFFSAIPLVAVAAMIAYWILDFRAGSFSPINWSLFEWTVNGAGLACAAFLIVSYAHMLGDGQRRTLVEKWLRCQVLER